MTYIAVEHCPVCGKWTKSSVPMAAGTGCTCKTPGIGQGSLRISPAFWSDLGCPKTPEDWKKALHLPECYQVESAVHPSPSQEGIVRDYIELIVTGIPQIEESRGMPEVTPYYINEGGNVFSLCRIEILYYKEDHE